MLGIHSCCPVEHPLTGDLVAVAGAVVAAGAAAVVVVQVREGGLDLDLLAGEPLDGQPFSSQSLPRQADRRRNAIGR